MTKAEEKKGRKIMARNFTDLEKAILTQIDGCDYLTEDNAGELQNCIQGGADCGISGFIYYADTCAFYDANREEILSQMIEEARDLGYSSAAEMISKFNCLRDWLDADEVEKQLFTGSEDELLKNALSWAVLESFAFSMEDEASDFLGELEEEEEEEDEEA